MKYNALIFKFVGLTGIIIVSLLLITNVLSKRDGDSTSGQPIPRATIDSNNSLERIDRLEADMEYIASAIETIANQTVEINKNLARLNEQQEIKEKEEENRNHAGQKELQNRDYTAEEIAALKQTQIDKLESEFFSEPIDGDWSSGSETSIRNLFSSSNSEVFLKTQVSSVECRQRSCKVSVSHEDGIDPEEFEIEFFKKMAELGMGRIRGYQLESNGKKENFFYTSPPRKRTSTAGL